MRTVEAIQVAREFATLAKQENDNNFTAMKLQKLLYYSQAWSLHRHGLPLFSEKIRAWDNGPVVPQVFQKFRGRYRLSFTEPELDQPSGLDDIDKELVFGVWQLYKRYTGDDLSELTHAYAAYQKARAKAGTLHRNPEIRHSDMVGEVQEYVRQQVDQIDAFVQGLSARER